MNSASFGGLIVPLVTPFKTPLELDREGVFRLVEYLLQFPIGALMVAGTTGEVMALSAEVRIELIGAVCEVVNKRVDVIAGVGSTAPADTLAFARAAHAAGASALSLQPPGYFPLNDAETLAYYRAMLDQVELPMILYNIPAFTGNTLSVDVVEQLAGDPRVPGIKDSTGNQDYFNSLMQRCAGADFFVNCGDEARMTECIEQGASGCTASLANVEPLLCLECSQAAAGGNIARAETLQAEIWTIIEPLRRQGWIHMLRWIKQRLAAQGICQPAVSMLYDTALPAQSTR